MKSLFLKMLTISLLKLAIKLRYQIKVLGLEKLPPVKGMVFLANAASEIDPLLIALALHSPVRPVLTKGLYQLHWLKILYQGLKAIFVPSYLGRISFQMNNRINLIKKALEKGENILIFPAGKLLLSPLDGIYNAFAYQVLQESNAPVIVVRIYGTWGSAFSDRIIGVDNDPIHTPWKAFLTLLKNGLFFMPKRKVVIDFQIASGLPKGDLDAFNGYLTQVFQEPSSHKLPPSQKGLYLVPYFFWQKKVELRVQQLAKAEIKYEEVPSAIKEEVFKEIAQLAKKDPASLAEKQHLFLDIGLNSLDVTELVIFLEEKYARKVNFEHLRTVEDVVLFAAGKKERPAPTIFQDRKVWQENVTDRSLAFPTAETIPEAFLKMCDRQGNALACAETHVLMSYNRMKSLAMGLAKEFEELEGDHIGVLIPSSSMMNIILLALMLAKKIPVMMNWTLGNRFLEEVVEKANLSVILTMEQFLKAVPYPISEEVQSRFLVIEEIRDTTTVQERRKGLALTRKKADKVLNYFSYRATKKDTAVILFTSGSEKSPKAVPLSFENLLSNQKGAVSPLDFQNGDVIMGLLPAFHVFGFSITNLMPLLYGLRVVYHSNPLDMTASLTLIERWGVTVICTTPTFLKMLLALGNHEKLKSVRLFIVGAEKAPPELFQMVESLGATLIEGYGITECSPIITLNRLNAPSEGVGFPLEGVTLKIVNPETKESVSPGEKGLILVRGPNVFSGYLGKEKDPFLHLEGKKWYVTGDIGYVDSKGALFLSGRLSRTIKIGGEMISLVAIEEGLGSELKKEMGEVSKPIQLAILSKDTKLYLFCNHPLSLEKANELLRKAGFSNLFRLEEVKFIDPFPVFATGKANLRVLESLLK